MGWHYLSHTFIMWWSSNKLESKFDRAISGGNGGIWSLNSKPLHVRIINRRDASLKLIGVRFYLGKFHKQHRLYIIGLVFVFVVIVRACIIFISFNFGVCFVFGFDVKGRGFVGLKFREWYVRNPNTSTHIVASHVDDVMERKSTNSMFVSNPRHSVHNVQFCCCCCRCYRSISIVIFNFDCFKTSRCVSDFERMQFSFWWWATVQSNLILLCLSNLIAFAGTSVCNVMCIFRIQSIHMGGNTVQMYREKERKKEKEMIKSFSE